jgi:transposase InsO family protein
MGRPGSALDNAVIESWHSTLEFELRAPHHFATRAQAAAWIDGYNMRRGHSSLEMMSPAEEAGQRDQLKSKCSRFQGNRGVSTGRTGSSRKPR